MTNTLDFTPARGSDPAEVIDLMQRTQPPPKPLPAVAISLPCLAALLDHVDTGIVLCGENGRVLLANDAARRELAVGGLLSISEQGCLVPLARSSNAVLAAALHGALYKQRRQLISLQSQSLRLVCVVMPLAGSDGPTDRAVVLFGRRHLTAELTLQMLGNLYGLTQAECRVLGGLLAGKAVVEVAQNHGVKVSTARTQVAAVRSKMGVRRTHDLALLVAQLPPVAGALRCAELPTLRHAVAA